MCATPPGKWGATVSPTEVDGKACVETVVVVAIAHFMYGARVEIPMVMISRRVGRESVGAVSCRTDLSFRDPSPSSTVAWRYV